MADCARIAVEFVSERHDCHEWEVNDLPMGDVATLLRVKFWQFHCPQCDKFFTPHYAVIVPGAHATERLLERMAEMIRFSDIRNAAGILRGGGEDPGRAGITDFVQRQRLRRGPKPPKPVLSLGIDELSLKKSTANSAAC